MGRSRADAPSMASDPCRLTAVEPSMGLSLGKHFQPIPVLVRMGVKGNFVQARGAGHPLGVRRWPQCVGMAACRWRSWGPRV